MSISNKKRSFVIEGSDIGFMGGIYHPNKSGSPGSAAKKAAKTLFRMLENKDNKDEWKKFNQFKDNKTIKFLLRESTSDSKKKSYYYEGKIQHIKKEDQKPVMINGMEIIHKKKIVVKTCSDGIKSVASVV